MNTYCFKEYTGTLSLAHAMPSLTHNLDPSSAKTEDDYHRLLIRWFQFGVFTPIFRVHGAGTHTEIWNFGNQTSSVINRSAITLRYRLLPYVYSGFWRVEMTGYTMQRASWSSLFHLFCGFWASCCIYIYIYIGLSRTPYSSSLQPPIRHWRSITAQT